MRRICITGPESTGKTTLAQQLADHIATAWVPEAARLYAERVHRELTSDDVELIAREHIALADTAAARVAAHGGTALVLDTDLVSTVVYAKSYYSYSSQWLTAQATARLADLYFLCDVDAPWIPDGIRDRPTDRAEMYESFRATLDRLDATVVRVSGSWEERWGQVLAAL